MTIDHSPAPQSAAAASLPPNSFASSYTFSSAAATNSVAVNTALMNSAERSSSSAAAPPDDAAAFSAAVANSASANTALLHTIEDLDAIVLATVSHVLLAERHEVRIASELPVVLDAGTPRAIFERLLPLHVAVDTPLLALWMHTFRAFSTPRELLVNLIDRFAKPLRRFQAASIEARLSTTQRNQIVARTRSQVLYILDYWLRHYVTDFIDDDRLFVECCAFLTHHRIRSTRDRNSGSFAPDVIASAAAAASVAVPASGSPSSDALSRSGEDDIENGESTAESSHSSRRSAGSSGVGGGRKHRTPAPASVSRMSSVDERRTSEQRAKLQLLITLQEEAGAHDRLVRVPRDMLTVDLLWGLMQSGDNGLSHEEVSELNGNYVRYATGADIVTWITRVINDDRGSARQWAQDVYAAHLLVPRSTPALAPAPPSTFSDSDSAMYRVSGESAVPFHRSRPSHETPSKKMLKYTDAADLDPKARTVLDFHPVELARQLALAAHECFVAVRPHELMSRAWMKDSADVHSQKCPNVKRMIEQFNRINRWVASEIVLVTDDAKQRLSVLKRMIEVAHCCRDVQNLHAMYAIYVGLNMWAVQRLKSLWSSLPAKWQKKYDEIDELANPKSNSAAMRTHLRALDPPIVPPIDLTLRDMTALGELDEFVEPIGSPRANGGAGGGDEQHQQHQQQPQQPPPLPLPPVAGDSSEAPPLPLQYTDADEHQFASEFAETRLVNMAKKRREADVLRRVRRCQRSAYVFATHAEIDRYLWHARTPFDDVQLTVLSNLCEPSQSSAGAGPADSESVLASLKLSGDVRSRVGSRFGGVFTRSRTSSVSKVKPQLSSANSSPVATEASKTRGRLASMPVRPQFDVAALAAAGKEADLKTEMLRAQTRSKMGLTESSEKPTSPAPLPPTSAASAALQRQRSSNRGSAPPMPSV